MKIYRPVSLILTILFAITGLLFLFIPGRVLTLFNNMSPAFHLPESPVTGFSFYLILAVGYMYLVTVLAFLMYRNPENKNFPLLLSHGKIASSLLSLGLFVFHAHYLIYITNFVIDGIIGIIVTIFYTRIEKTGP